MDSESPRNRSVPCSESVDTDWCGVCRGLAQMRRRSRSCATLREQGGPAWCSWSTIGAMGTRSGPRSAPGGTCTCMLWLESRNSEA